MNSLGARCPAEGMGAGRELREREEEDAPTGRGRVGHEFVRANLSNIQ